MIGLIVARSTNNVIGRKGCIPWNIDGEKQHLISDLNYAFCGVYVPEGKHDIKLQYSNPGINKGILLFVSGWILLAGVCGAQIMRRKRQ